MAHQFDFLESFIHNVLDEAGFEEMSETNRAQFVPLFVAEAERRLGLALLPRLSEEQGTQLAQFGTSENISVDDLARFWQESVPDFKEVVEQTLTDFAQEFKQTLAGVAQ